MTRAGWGWLAALARRLDRRRDRPVLRRPAARRADDRRRSSSTRRAARHGAARVPRLRRDAGRRCSSPAARSCSAACSCCVRGCRGRVSSDPGTGDAHVSSPLDGQGGAGGGRDPRRRARHRRRAGRGGRDRLLHGPQHRASSARSTTGRRRSRRPPSSSTPAGGAGIARRGRPPGPGAGRRRSSGASTPSTAASTCSSTTSGAARSCSSGTRRCGSTTSTTACGMLRLAVETHLITSHFALPLLIRRPGGLVVEMTDGTREYNDDALPRCRRSTTSPSPRSCGWPSPRPRSSRRTAAPPSR